MPARVRARPYDPPRPPVTIQQPVVYAGAEEELAKLGECAPGFVCFDAQEAPVVIIKD
jgi:hypothetical protein